MKKVAIGVTSVRIYAAFSIRSAVSCVGCFAFCCGKGAACHRFFDAGFETPLGLNNLEIAGRLHGGMIV